MSEYIFVTGAPGSMWSSVVKNIYFSSDINQSDFTPERTYHAKVNPTDKKKKLHHIGSYFDPGMEFGNYFDKMDSFHVKELEKEFNRPFIEDNGKKIIKSHFFAYHLDFIKANWDVPIVLVYRNSDACMGWWVRLGNFNITYPNYQYYVNLNEMMTQIISQNKKIMEFVRENQVIKVRNSLELCSALKINNDFISYQDYTMRDFSVYVYWQRHDGSLRQMNFSPSINNSEVKHGNKTQFGHRPRRDLFKRDYS